MVSVPKKDHVDVISNYRPISLLSLVSKLPEQIVRVHVSEFVEFSLSNLQYGFRKTRSCVTQLFGVSRDAGKALRLFSIYAFFTRTKSKSISILHLK